MSILKHITRKLYPIERDNILKYEEMLFMGRDDVEVINKLNNEIIIDITKIMLKYANIINKQNVKDNPVGIGYLLGTYSRMKTEVSGKYTDYVLDYVKFMIFGIEDYNFYSDENIASFKRLIRNNKIKNHFNAECS